MSAEIENSNLLKNKKKNDILDLFPKNGHWQRKIFIITFITAIPVALQNLSISFFAPNLDHWCSRPIGTNITVEKWKLDVLPLHDQKCSRYNFFNTSHVSTENNSYNNYGIIPCESWEYDTSLYTSTILSEWDLVCEKEWLVSLSKSLFAAGTLLSSPFEGYISDKYGRKPVIVGCNILALLSSVICAFSTSFLMFSITRFFIAVGASGAFNSAFVLLMEVASPSHRSVYGLSVELGWCLGFMSLPLIAWILRDWFWIQLTISLPSAFLLFTFWLLSESPRWLVAHGRIKEVENVLTKDRKTSVVDRINLRENIKEIILNKNKENEKKQSDNFLGLLKTHGVWKNVLNLFYIWCVLGFVYYGLTYNTNELAGDPFINFAASGAVEIPGYLISIFIIKFYGRRNPLSAFLIIGGVACLLMYPIPSDMLWISFCISMLGKFCITCAFGIIYIYTAEILPTVVRNVGISSASFCARIGSILAPFVRELGNATHPVVPQIIYGILAVIGGLLILLLPETNNCTVPDTFEEAAHFRCKSSDRRKANHHIIMKEFECEKA
ncbi:organic cation transporter protein [Parasteatoda tepidariorum]|uniref:organic cation transporter protein n=1 Tax=Parasteatoda tepidariorum TaxID=114398 RepID=UPI001C71D83D|nr:organic cation transporter protein [Parasteatoda tepidariorum]